MRRGLTGTILRGRQKKFKQAPLGAHNTYFLFFVFSFSRQWIASNQARKLVLKGFEPSRTSRVRWCISSDRALNLQKSAVSIGTTWNSARILSLALHNRHFVYPPRQPLAARR
jgi:hypothetical protein